VVSKRPHQAALISSSVHVTSVPRQCTKTISSGLVALSDSDADTVQTYEYSVYGQVAASTNFLTNPYMFTGRRFDLETGLYFLRARYYNPHIGRFMQTDPIGYGAGMNLHAYCGNNPVGRTDPSGLYWTFLDSWYVEKYGLGSGLVFAWVNDTDTNPLEPNPDNVTVIKVFNNLVLRPQNKDC
jgi:RHS repeat-associated protein